MMNETDEITKIKKDDIWAYICNLTPTDMIEYGNVLPRPGEETAWYDRLPASLRIVSRHSVYRENFAL